MKKQGTALPLISYHLAGRTVRTPGGELHVVMLELVTGGSSRPDTWPQLAVTAEEAIRFGDALREWGQKLLAANASGPMQ